MPEAHDHKLRLLLDLGQDQFPYGDWVFLNRLLDWRGPLSLGQKRWFNDIISRHPQVQSHG
jgi:hypothetical protein